MTKQTTTTISIAALYFVCFFAVLVYAYISVRAEQVKYGELATTLATETAKQTVANQITELSSSTVTERTQLQHYFVTEKETISFITETEAIARAIGIKLETTNLDLVPASNKNLALLKTGFHVSGSETGVMTFMRMMESLPYHSRVPMMDITHSTDGGWQGTIMLEVTVTP